MTLEAASLYLSLDRGTFETVAAIYAVAPVLVDNDKQRWRKADLDRYTEPVPFAFVNIMHTKTGFLGKI